jgi:voltage-gated potassium channel
MNVFLSAHVLTAATVLIHCFGTHLSLSWSNKIAINQPKSRWLHLNFMMVTAIVILLLTHFLEVVVWAGFYYLWGLQPDMPTATYFSMTSYSTVGYGDVLLPVPWRLLGPTEAVVGVLMLGWSTATIVAIVQKIYRDRTF